MTTDVIGQLFAVTIMLVIISGCFMSWFSVSGAGSRSFSCTTLLMSLNVVSYVSDGYLDHL